MKRNMTVVKTSTLLTISKRDFVGRENFVMFKNNTLNVATQVYAQEISN